MTGRAVAVATSLVLLVVAAPATGASRDASMRDPRALWDDAALASGLDGLPTAAGATAHQAATTPTLHTNSNRTALVTPVSEALEGPGDSADSGDTAPKTAISPAVPQPAGDIATPGTAIHDTKERSPVGTEFGAGSSVSDLARGSRSRIGKLPTPENDLPRISRQVAGPVGRNHGGQYHDPAHRYHIQAIPSNVSDRIPRQKRRTPTPIRDRVDRPIVRPICASISCQQAGIVVPDVSNVDRGNNVNGNTAELAPHNRPAARVGAPGSDVLPTIGVWCGNTNISIRISSPGDDGEVTQVDAPVAAAGDGHCAGNTNISVRINSPGDNGAVSQASAAGAAALAGAPAPEAGSTASRRRHTAGVGIRPLDLGRTRRPAQAPAKTASPHPASVHAQSQPVQSSAGATVPVRASKPVGSSPAGATAGMDRAERISTPRLDRHTASLPRRSSLAGDGGSGFGVEALLIALIATFAVSYVFVPPLRPLRLGAFTSPRLFRR